MYTNSKLLINESPLTVLPSLVAVVGLERAILLQQIQYLLQQKTSGKILDDGFKYIWNTSDEFHKNWFPFWKPDTIRKHLKILEDEGFLISRKPNAKQRNHTKFYRIDYEKLNAQIREISPEELPVEPDKVNDLDAASYSESNRNIVGIEPEYNAASDSEYSAGSIKESKTSTKTPVAGGVESNGSGDGKPAATAIVSQTKNPEESQDAYLIRKQLEYPHLDVQLIFKTFAQKVRSGQYEKLKLTRPQFDKWLETEHPPMKLPEETNGAVKPSRRQQIENCATCDKNGYIKIGDGVKICKHQKTGEPAKI